MVRPDHEDGGELNPDSSADQPRPVVRKSSPLGRSRRRRSSPVPNPSTGAVSRDTASCGGSEDGEKLADDAAFGDDAVVDDGTTAAPDEVDTPDRPAGAQPVEDAAAAADEAEALAEGDDEAEGTAGAESDDDAEDDEAVVVDADRAGAVSYRDRRVRRGKKGPKNSGTGESGTDDTETDGAGKRERSDGKAKSSKAESGRAKNSRANSGKARGLARRAPAGERSRLLSAIAVAVGVVVVVGCIVASVVFTVKYDELSDQRRLRNDYATFAKQVVVEMTTLNPENADDIYKLSQQRTTGRAQQMFRDNMKMVAQMIREGNAITSTTVLSDAVTKATDKEGQVIMVFGWVGRTTDPKDEPIYQTFRWKVDVATINGQMKVSNMEFVI